ncbi:hypothetical protein PHLCEN_2v2187 [Hermanssonia centrifuga]|uniref:Uncharacterized protein n=1 Tax=Hermanssonia centrifuga TaxID=98765 RepID=A0A2R6RPT8_9APHY|nr:hypothetical protein PHLCEN_2v2187 [Hermanssonia centrifuga]
MLLEELAPPLIPGHTHNTHVACALCGASILDNPSTPTRIPPLPHSPSRLTSQSKSSWGPSFLKTSLVQTISSAPFANHSRPATPTLPNEPPTQVYIFRLEATSSSGLPVSLPLSSQQPGSQNRPTTIYPLCANGWCLARLRTTCSLWAFIRTGIVERVWEEETYRPPSPKLIISSGGRESDTSAVPADARPSLIPKRSQMGIKALWGSMSRSLSNTPKAESEKAEVDASNDASKSPPPVPPRRLPPPPPQHPPLPPSPTTRVPGPPPLPKRNRERASSSLSTEANAESKSDSVEGTGQPSESTGTPAQSLVPVVEDNREEFTTPTEEISQSSMSRSSSPTTVPLPPSEPSTPLQPATQVPSESVAAGAAGETTRVATPPPIQLQPEGSRPTSPAPPPLPRRAAARVRPSSIVVPSAPASQAVAQSQEDKSEAEPVGAMREEALESTNESTLSAPVETAAEQHDETKSTLSAEPGPDSHEILSTSSPGELSDSEHVETEAHLEDVGSRVQAPLDDEKVSEEPGAYVTDSTWEERTWKELVKLRQDMFWARVGGVR